MFRLLIACLAACLAQTAAFAAIDPRITVTVEPIPPSVTLSRAAGLGDALTTYAAYKVTITNGAASALNRVFFNATAVGVGSSEALVIDSSVPAAACTITGNQAACSLPSLAPGTSSTPIYLVVRAPLTGTRIDLNYEFGGDEGNGGGNGCCSQLGTKSTDLIDPTTDTSYRRKLTSFVKPTGDTFFTGDGAIPTSDDGWTTRVKVPPFTSLPTTTAKIEETKLDQSCGAYLVDGGCFRTELTIPGTFASLEIEFLLNKSLYTGNGSAAALKYDGSATHPQCSAKPTDPACVNFAYPITVGLCTADASTYGSAPTSGRPCLSEPPKKLGSQDNVPRALWGALRYKVRALDNGIYSNE